MPHWRGPAQACARRAKSKYSSAARSCRSSSLHPFALDHDAAFVVNIALFNAGALLAAARLRDVALFADDTSILDTDNAFGERHYTRVMSDHQHGAGGVLG